MPETAIAVSHLSKSFGRGVKALDDVSLEIARGEMVALIGASGSGKSTLIRHVAGLLPSDRESCCRVCVLDTCVQDGGRIDPRARRLRTRIGVVFQQFNLVGRLGLLTNVAIGALGRMPAWRGTLGLFGREERMRAMVALARVDMARYAGQKASTLSGGQQQRAAIARTLVQQAEVILADEPIASLDPESARRVMDLLARINAEEGITVVVSLHQVAYARKYCPRTIALRAGRIVYDGPSEALTPGFLRELYGADSEELIMDETMAAPAAAARPQPQPAYDGPRVAAFAAT